MVAIWSLRISAHLTSEYVQAVVAIVQPVKNGEVVFRHQTWKNAYTDFEHELERTFQHDSPAETHPTSFALNSTVGSARASLYAAIT